VWAGWMKWLRCYGKRCKVDAARRVRKKKKRKAIDIKKKKKRIKWSPRILCKKCKQSKKL